MFVHAARRAGVDGGRKRYKDNNSAFGCNLLGLLLLFYYYAFIFTFKVTEIINRLLHKFFQPANFILVCYLYQTLSL